MAFHRLIWRVGLPTVLLVLGGTVALAVYTGRLIANEDTQQFEQAAAANARFLEFQSMQMQMGDALARPLAQVTGYRVHFRTAGRVEPEPPNDLRELPLATLPADGRAVQVDAHEVVAVRVADTRTDLLFVRDVRSTLLDTRTLPVLGAFLALAVMTAWLVVRGLVLPLRRLARHLPEIEAPGPIDLPDASRNDEIGDLARAFVRTRDALQAERESRERAERLAVLGRMTGALAHEVQNPVAAIRMHAQLWHEDRGSETAAIIEHEAARIESLLNQWMFLTRPEAPAVREVDVAHLLAQVVASHRAQAEHAAVRIDTHVDGDACAAADGKRLAQVASNLVTNAIQAMPHGGTLAIHAWGDTEWLHVKFADSGRGFSPSALQRFAEFFYSEKEGGMGIGLSVASEILKAHGGALRVQNREQGGAEVTISLPRRAVTAPSPAPTTAPPIRA